MKLIGNVAPEEVPTTSKPGEWADLAGTIIEDHMNGRVTYVQADSRDEVNNIRGHLAHHLHRQGFSGRTTAIEKNGHIDLYISLVDYRPPKKRRNNSS